MNFERTIAILNDLLEINNDRIEGYKTAIGETEDFDLQRIFKNLKETSVACKRDLEQEIINCGGSPSQETKTTGKMFRAWMDFKAAISSKNRATILNSCEQGEDVAVHAYEDVLNDHPSEHLSANQISMIDEQYRLIKSDHDLVRSLRNTTLSH
jgi:uncharacterized protein (TIGR02284 family)